MFATVLPAILAAVLATSSLSQDPVTIARRLRDNGRFAEAIRVLGDRLRENPTDTEAARLLAQTLYWMKDIARARAIYAETLASHPNDQQLRVEYARMLAETGERRSALQVLAPLENSGRSDAHALLGTIRYWEGDLSGAKRHFLSASRTDPSNAEAARQLAEIEQISAPWLRLDPVVWRDDQPLNRRGIAIEAGRFVTPLFSIAARSAPVRYSTSTVQTFWSNEVEIAHYSPRSKLESRIAAGLIRRPAPVSTFGWTGRADLGLRAARSVTVRGRVERAPYLHTVASLTTSVDTTSAIGIVQVNDRRGWLGEAAIQRQTFPDSNAILGAYAWLMAPIAQGARGRFQVGYAFATSDADEDRFALARSQQPFLPSDPRFDFSGVYDPYYTPQRVVTHSVVAAITAGSTGPVLRAGGSYALRAAEDATAFQASGNQVASVIGRRSYSPWTIRGSLDIPAGRALTLVVGAESGRTAYYRWTTARVQLAYRFLPRSAAAAATR